MPKFTLPAYQATKYKKQYVYNKLGKVDNVMRILDIDRKTFRNWGMYIPAPYADRLWLSDWGNKEVQPYFVSVEDSLVIFKRFKLLAQHFGRKKTWKEDTMVYLPEPESAYMIRHFSNFMRIYNLKDIEKIKYYL